MQSDADLRVLAAAGIDDPDLLTSAAANFLRKHPLNASKFMTGVLSPQEDNFLREGGALGVGEVDLIQIRDNIATVSGEYAQMVLSALSQKEVAGLLSVTPSRIRQRIENRSLYTVEAYQGRVFPRFQFWKQGTLPGIERVLVALSPAAHPVAVQRFFLTVSRDLESDQIDAELSPRDWLMSGHSPAPLIELAGEL